MRKDTTHFLTTTLVLVANMLLGPLTSVGSAIGAVVGPSVQADVVDYDEVKSGEHREGLYFGLWKMTVKLSRALGLALSGFLLHAIGFETATPVVTPISTPIASVRRMVAATAAKSALA